MITVVINGTSFDYPEVGDTEWGDAATNAFKALAGATLQNAVDISDPTATNEFTLLNTLDLGGNYGVKVLFISSRSSNPAQSGVFRLCNGELVAWRNNDDDGDNTITFDSDGDLLVNGVKVTLHGQIVNADVAAGAGIEESKLSLDYSTDSLNTAITTHVTDTSNPHNVTKSQVLTGDLIVNADVDNSAAIVESKLSLDYSTSGLNTAITSHTGDTSNPHSTTISNLTDTTITTPSSGDVVSYVGSKWINQANSVSNLTDTTITSASSGDVLSYDGSKWVNAPSSSASLSGLSDTDITTPSNGDTLLYNSVSTKWENSNQLTTVDTNLTLHTSNTSNPHSTTVSNLDDTTITTPSDQDTMVYDSNSSKWINQENSVDNLTNVSIDSNTLAVGDALVFDDQDSLWKNDASFTNHIGNAANPHLTTVAKLTDTTITTLANNDVLLYDYANSQWINSPIIEINDIANINTAVTDVTLTASDKRHQIFTATDGFNITLPSTNIKAGEKFIFDFSQDVNYFTTPYVLKVGVSDLAYAYNGCYRYTCIAITDNPTTLSDWKLIYTKTKELILHGEYDNSSFLIENGLRNEASSSTVYTLSAGVWEVSLSFGINGGTISTGAWWFYAINSNGGVIVSYDTEAIGSVIQMSIQNSRPTASLTINGVSISGSTMQGNTITKLANVTTVTANVSLGASIANTGATETVRLIERSTARLVEPRITALN